MNPTVILAKEVVNPYMFAQHDVLQDSRLRADRKSQIQKATALGNIYQHKVKIICQMADGQVGQLLTTIWQSDDNHVSLKGGRTIPVNAILRIEY
ncbi:hypothetical protein [Rhodoflexus caldus]|uniref:hypothetical protein n=1 Tax=Rhodoflexus caldus TaxID=2891236 RepID=UPI00202AAD99|nr:hypothetical protein [Rhodoflexus caldus]